MRLSYSTPCEPVGTIKVNKPITRLGRLVDAQGMEWDIHAIVGKHVTACPYNVLHPYFTDTSGANYDMVSQTWEPYTIELVDCENKWIGFYDEK